MSLPELATCPGVDDLPCYQPLGHESEWHAHEHPATGFFEYRITDHGTIQVRATYLGQPIEGEHPLSRPLTTEYQPKLTRGQKFGKATRSLSVTLTLVFLALAVDGIIAWPWWLLAAPVLLPFALYLLLVLILGILAAAKKSGRD